VPVKKAEAIIEEIIRPLVEADGGTVEIVALTDTLVHLRLAATCAGCPGKTHTRAQVIEPLFRTALGDAVEIQVE
jgi:Fe-S cluster biogenesis protein NfuA